MFNISKKSKLYSQKLLKSTAVSVILNTVLPLFFGKERSRSMKKTKIKAALVAAGAFLTAGLYAYSLYSAYYTFKRGVKSDIVLYTVLLAVCSGVIMLLYTLTDKKRTHSTVNKITVPVITAVVNAGVYLAVAYGFQAAFSPNSGGKLAASVSAAMFGIAYAVFFNGIASRGHKAVWKTLAALSAVAMICWGGYTTAASVKDQSYLSVFYASSKASENIGGIPTADKDIVFDFAYATEKDVRDTALGTDETIDIKLAKNEHEGFQILFATAAKDKKVSVSVTDFKNTDGDTLKTEAFKENYSKVPGFGDKYSCEYADALIPVTHTGERGGPAELKKGLQQGFFIRVYADKDAKAGEYTAVVTAKNEKNEIILEKEIKATVWNFVLPDAPANETAFGNYSGVFYKLSGVADGDDAAREKVFLQVYEMLLENRMSPYNLPYDILDDRADAYMSDPRLTSFRAPFPEDDDLLVKYYEKLKSNPEWLKKAYFYPVDEPQNAEAYAIYNAAVERRNRLAPGLNIVTPFNTDRVTVDGKESTSVELQAGKSNILCGISNVASQDDIHSEMMNEVKNGSRAWWYVCCNPGGDYCNFFVDKDALEQRILMWQQKSLDITGLLYWCATWCDNGNPWETSKTWLDYSAAGDGCIIYPGGYIGLDEPVSTIRLVNIADGMEDYDCFALAEEKFGRDWVDEKIAKVTTSATEYTSDHALFEQVRREICEALNTK